MRLIRTSLVLVLASLLLAACGDAPLPSDSSKPHGSGRATVTLDPVKLEGGQFKEGFRATYDVLGSDYHAEEALLDQVKLRLDPGTHTLQVHVRPCDANCGNLDTGFECAHDVKLRAGEHMRLSPIVHMTSAPEMCDWGDGPERWATLTIRALQGVDEPQTVRVDDGDPINVALRAKVIRISPGTHTVSVRFAKSVHCRLTFDLASGDAVEVTPHENARCTVMHGTLSR